MPLNQNDHACEGHQQAERHAGHQNPRATRTPCTNLFAADAAKPPRSDSDRKNRNERNVQHRQRLEAFRKPWRSTRGAIRVAARNAPTPEMISAVEHLGSTVFSGRRVRKTVRPACPCNLTCFHAAIKTRQHTRVKSFRHRTHSRQLDTACGLGLLRPSLPAPGCRPSGHESVAQPAE